MATLKDIANRCGASPATISRILNNDETLKVTPQLRSAVLLAAKELNYVPRRQRQTRTYLIGFKAAPLAKPGYEEAFFSRLANISQKFDVSIEEWTESKIYDALIVLGEFTVEELSILHKKSPHLLLINSAKIDYRYDRIVMDYKNAEEQVLAYFLEKGIEDIGYYGGIYRTDDVVIGERRMSYFQTLLEQQGLYRPENFVLGTMDSMSGYQLTLSSPRIPQALFISDCGFAEGALRALGERGIECEVVVYQDMEDASFSYNYPHSVLQIFTDGVFEAALKLLIERICGERDTVYSISVPATLIDKTKGETV